jgi:hypothetical protein
MQLNRVERSRALAYLLKQDYAAFGRLIEDTNNLSRDSKIDLLSSALQLAAPGARISYGDDSRRVIDVLVSVINGDQEDNVRLIASDVS